MKTSLLNRLQELRSAKIPVGLLTDISSGEQSLITVDDTTGDLQVTATTHQDALNRLKQDRSGRLDQPDDHLFLQCHNPPLRLLIIGAVHVAQTLAPMASLAGYEVTVIDPRRSFATADRFPDVSIVCEWPDEAVEALAPDARTAMITLTHDPKLDDPALRIILRTEAFYIGCLGSRKTHALRLQRLHEAGFSETDTVRIYGPLGLPIGAKSPPEIAVSALSQMIETLRKSPSVTG